MAAPRSPPRARERERERLRAPAAGGPWAEQWGRAGDGGLPGRRCPPPSGVGVRAPRSEVWETPSAPTPRSLDPAETATRCPLKPGARCGQTAGTGVASEKGTASWAGRAVWVHAASDLPRRGRQAPGRRKPALRGGVGWGAPAAVGVGPCCRVAAASPPRRPRRELDCCWREVDGFRALPAEDVAHTFAASETR